MIGAAGVADRDGGSAEVLKWCKPRLEHRAHHVVVLQVDAADLARAVVQVEIARQFRVLGLERHGFAVGEVILYIRFRTEQALLLASPQRDAHRTWHVEFQRFEDPYYLHGYGASGSVVGGAGAARPGIEMRSQHH